VRVIGKSQQREDAVEGELQEAVKAAREAGFAA